MADDIAPNSQERGQGDYAGHKPLDEMTNEERLAYIATTSAMDEYNSRNSTMTPEQANRVRNVGGGDKFLSILSGGLHDPYKNAMVVGAAETRAAQAQRKVTSGLNQSVWDAPTSQQRIIEALTQSYNPGVASGQGQLAAMLMEQAQGKGDSIAQRQLRAGADQNLQNSLAMQGAARGASAQGAQRLAQLQHAQVGNQLNQDAGIMRLQEQRSAQGQLAGLYGQMGNQNAQNLGLQSNLSEANRQAAIDRERILSGLRQQEALTAEARYQEARGDSKAATDMMLKGAEVGARALGTVAVGMS